jgi:hypothetical protein
MSMASESVYDYYNHLLLFSLSLQLYSLSLELGPDN